MKQEELSYLNALRRPLDGLDSVEILDKWKFDQQLALWYLPIAVTSEYQNILLPNPSQWYVVARLTAEDEKFNIFPSKNNGLLYTFPHQARNGTLAKGGLWYSGEPCLEEQSIFRNELSEYKHSERILFYKVQSLVIWINKVLDGSLVTPTDSFELPDFRGIHFHTLKFIFVEDQASYQNWISQKQVDGLAKVGITNYDTNKKIFFLQNFVMEDSEVSVNWGSYFSKNTEISCKAIWVKLNQIPVFRVWQPPKSLSELITVCENQNINIIAILKKYIQFLRDGQRHLLLLGFPIPNKFGDSPSILHWQAIQLPIFSIFNQYANGYRNNERGQLQNDLKKILKPTHKLNWIQSENWHQSEILQRGKMTTKVSDRNILLIGCGCIGSAIAEMLVRAGVTKITLLDDDSFSIGNVARHTLDITHINTKKVVSLQNRLNKCNPNAQVEYSCLSLSFNKTGKPNFSLEEFDIIIDCSGSNSLLSALCDYVKRTNKFLFSASIGLKATHLYLHMSKGSNEGLKGFCELIKPYTEQDRQQLSITDLPKDGTGCWHPTFPARSDDIWLAASVTIKAFEKYINQDSLTPKSLVYKQSETDSTYEGFCLVEEK